MFCSAEYAARKIQLAPSDSLLLYTDGLSEARDTSNAEYGLARISRFVAARHALPPRALTVACLDDLRAFQAGTPKADDLTIMILRRTG